MKSSKIISYQLITKGWSSDKKYKVQLEDGRFGLLRISELAAYDRKQAEFALLHTLSAQTQSIPKPIESWQDEQCSYHLFEWIEGQDMNDAAPSLSKKELYELGCQAGYFLRMLHDLPICQSKRDWQDFYQAKMDAKLANYQAGLHSYKQGDLMLEVVTANRHLIRERPICYHHGDFHTGNFLLGSDKQLKILDFGSHDIGDPWEEFNRLIFTAHLSSEFACGQIDTYFEGHIPDHFWSLLLLYLTVNSLGALPWAERVDPTQIPFVTSQAEILSDWYDSFRLPIPKWYLETRDKIRKMTDF